MPGELVTSTATQRVRARPPRADHVPPDQARRCESDGNKSQTADLTFQLPVPPASRSSSYDSRNPTPPTPAWRAPRPKPLYELPWHDECVMQAELRHIPLRHGSSTLALSQRLDVMAEVFVAKVVRAVHLPLFDLIMAAATSPRSAHHAWRPRCRAREGRCRHTLRVRSPGHIVGCPNREAVSPASRGEIPRTCGLGATPFQEPLSCCTPHLIVRLKGLSCWSSAVTGSAGWRRPENRPSVRG